MINMLNKELKLTIGPLFYVLPLIMGLLMLIPNWLYFLVFLYFCFITVPNTLASCKAQNDVGFSVLMPVTKKEIVQARILSFSLLELMHITAGVLFAIISRALYGTMGLFLTPNVAFFGLVFVMYSIFNLILFPMYYKSAYKYGAAVTVSTVVTFLFAAGIELIAVFYKGIGEFLRKDSIIHWAILAIGIIMFVVFNYIAYVISFKRFRKIDV